MENKNNVQMQLSVIKNNDINKAFGISFPSLQYNDKGMAHVVEHCIMSDYFKSASIFSTIKEKTLCNYIDAFTHADRTDYFFCTCYNADYLLLMKLFYDMLMVPSFLYDKSIFMKEAGRSGVVVNEMKDYYAVVEKRIFYQINQIVNKENIYQYSVGGIPDEISKLTEGEVISYYKKYYDPCKARFFIYGDIDENNILSELEETFWKRNEISNLGREEKYKSENGNSVIQELYGVFGVKQSKIYTLTYMIGLEKEKKYEEMIRILCKYLFGRGSLVRQYVRKKGICENFKVKIAKQGYFLQCVLYMESEEDYGEKFLHVVRQGIDEAGQSDDMNKKIICILKNEWYKKEYKRQEDYLYGVFLGEQYFDDRDIVNDEMVSFAKMNDLVWQRYSIENLRNIIFQKFIALKPSQREIVVRGCI